MRKQYPIVRHSPSFLTTGAVAPIYCGGVTDVTFNREDHAIEHSGFLYLIGSKFVFHENDGRIFTQECLVDIDNLSWEQEEAIMSSRFGNRWRKDQLQVTPMDVWMGGDDYVAPMVQVDDNGRSLCTTWQESGSGCKIAPFTCHR